MESKKEFNLKHFRLIFFVVAIVHSIICLIFSYNFSYVDVFKSTESIINYFVSMLICVAMVVAFWQFIATLISKIKSKDHKYKLFIKFFLIFFMVMIVFYILTFPGYWCNDEFTILTYSKRFILYGWHHFFTQILYICGLFLFIHPTLIVLFQIILVSALVGYVLSDFVYFLESRFNHNIKWKYWLLVPFLLPSTILQVLFPLRLTLYAFIELTTVYEIVMLFISKKRLTINKIILLGLFIPILSFWRSESIIYIILLPLVLFFIIRKNLTKKLITVFLSCFLVMSAFMFVPQKIALQKNNLDTSMFNEYNNPTVVISSTLDNYETAYNISGIISSFVQLAKLSYEDNDEYVDRINEFIDIQYLYDNDINGTVAFWNNYINFQNFEGKLGKFQKLYISLIFKHFPNFLKERFATFLVTNGFNYKAHTFINNSAAMPQSSYGYGVMECVFAPKLRKYVINFLQLGKKGSPNIFPYHIIYNSIFGLITLLVFCIVCLKKSNKHNKFYLISLLFLIVLAKNALIFLTAPDTFFMYYFSTMLLGDFILCSYLVYSKNKHIEQHLKLTEQTQNNKED